MRILPIGGRIKAASVGLDHFYPGDNLSVEQVIAKLRHEPLPEMQKAFFPRIGNELKQCLRGVGFYRPSLKTDQGMPGNFLPFTIDASLEKTDMSVRTIGHEEGVAIPEPWYENCPKTTADLQTSFLKFDLAATYEHLQRLDSRRAEKGRLPFFFIRPALPDSPIIIGKHILEKVEAAVQSALAKLLQSAERREHALTGLSKPTNLIYVQPDVYVLTDSSVVVEKINCPDVGFFLAEVEAKGSTILPLIRLTMQRMKTAVAFKIIEQMGERITIVTRDEVVAGDEDVLEIREIKMLQEALTHRGANVSVIPVSAVKSLEKGARLLLLNLDYRTEGAKSLLRLHADGAVECFPNPFFQKVCQEKTGLEETKLDPATKHGRTFLDLARSQPASPDGMRDVLRLIDRALTNTGMMSDIIHVALPTETVPVFRRSLHSWRQFAARASRPENQGDVIRFRGIPAVPGNLMLTSSTGPRLHAFRFMCVA